MKKTVPSALDTHSSDSYIEFSEFEIIECKTFVLRVPVRQPVRTAFGIMYDRPAVIVQLSDDDGFTGWGEVWCNFPACGAEHRARLIDTELAPLVLNAPVSHPAKLFKSLTSSLNLLVNQTGEPGPVAQAIAGIDIALWDLIARRKNVPLCNLLGGEDTCIPVYASGLNPDRPEQLAEKKLACGFRAFKLKVGFGNELDTRNVRSLRDRLGIDVKLMIDANQAWNIEQTQRMSSQLAKFDLTWIEEPLPVNAQTSEWQALANAVAVPLAGGENLCGYADFKHAIDSRCLSYMQPDVAKWGGITGCHKVAAEISAANLVYCPHWLGGGVGLLASAHLLAANGGAGILEVDANPNPLRDELMDWMPETVSGAWRLNSEPGLGAQPNMDLLQRYLVYETSRSKVS